MVFEMKGITAVIVLIVAIAIGIAVAGSVKSFANKAAGRQVLK